MISDSRALADKAHSNGISSDLPLMLEVLPARFRDSLACHPHLAELVEVVLDLGRLPEVRFFETTEDLGDQEVTHEEIDFIVERVGDFGGDNRAGIERTLHRISAIRNRRGRVVGLTCRVGRAVSGTIDIIRDVIDNGESLLLLGPPGVGKTTLLREAARVLAGDLRRRVIIVDTSNEIGGDGDVPHPGIGRARRMQVPSPESQHQVMIEAVENHMPEVILIDEIGNLADALAARTIAERGVQLIATAHGITLENLIVNPTLSDLVGGIQAVTLSDDEARRRGTQKTVLERKAPPTFDVLVEIQNRDQLAVYRQLASVVDHQLLGFPISPEIRRRASDGSIQVDNHGPQQPLLRNLEARQPMSGRRSSPFGKSTGTAHRQRPQGQSPPPGPGPGRLTGPLSGFGRVSTQSTRIYPIGVNRTRLERAIREVGAPARLADQPINADLILSLKAQRKRQPKKLQQALHSGVDFHVVKSNTVAQLKVFLRRYFQLSGDEDEDRLNARTAALEETEDAVIRVQRSTEPVELAPQNALIRRQQHLLVQRHGLISESRGKAPNRRVVVIPNTSDLLEAPDGQN